MDFKVGDELDIEVYPEICCDLCNEVIHNHIDCPVCKHMYAETDQYIDLYGETELMCEECETVFELIGDSWYYDARARIKSIKISL